MFCDAGGGKFYNTSANILTSVHMPSKKKTMVYRSVVRLLLSSDSCTYTPTDDEIYRYMRRVFKRMSPFAALTYF